MSHIRMRKVEIILPAVHGHAGNTSSTRCPSHSPSGPRKVASPLSAEIPAPVRMTMLRMVDMARL